jgi:hypothetical protein
MSRTRVFTSLLSLSLVSFVVAACTAGTATGLPEGGIVSSGGMDGSANGRDGGTTVTDSGGPTGPTSVSASSFDQSCTQDTDCIPVYQGDVCGNFCAGDNASINVSAETAYQAAVNAAQKNCPPQMGGGGSCASGFGSITFCDASKKCEYKACPGPTPATDPHKCPGSADGGDAG